MPVNAYTIAQCNYGEAFTAAVQKDNFTACSFTRNAPAPPVRNC